ncbi:hypothetical protein MP228_012713 [Amoeboaphelidium protococcarum]|nr:hypothetical protein MP228_012713 [Amoeboaphelidium protococcarum]
MIVHKPSVIGAVGITLLLAATAFYLLYTTSFGSRAFEAGVARERGNDYSSRYGVKMAVPDVSIFDFKARVAARHGWYPVVRGFRTPYSYLNLTLVQTDAEEIQVKIVTDANNKHDEYTVFSGYLTPNYRVISIPRFSLTDMDDSYSVYIKVDNEDTRGVMLQAISIPAAVGRYAKTSDTTSITPNKSLDISILHSISGLTYEYYPTVQNLTYDQQKFGPVVLGVDFVLEQGNGNNITLSSHEWKVGGKEFWSLSARPLIVDFNQIGLYSDWDRQDTQTYLKYYVKDGDQDVVIRGTFGYIAISLSTVLPDY